MQKIHRTKKRLGIGIAAAAFAAVAAIGAGAPAAFADPANTSFTIDFIHTTIPGNPALGDTFVGNGSITDDHGNLIGTAVDHCAEDLVTADSTTVQCTTTANLPGGKLDIDAEAPIPDNQTAYPYTFDGVIKGGTGEYDGASGQAHITAKEPGVYHVTLELR